MRLWRPAWLPYGSQGGGGTAFPPNMGVAATGDPAFAEIAGRITANEARAVGVHWVLAPVADVNTAPDNPIVNVRSYGSDAATVASFVSAFVRGVQSGGALTAARIDESVERILSAKAGVGLHQHRLVDVDAVHTIVAAPAHEAAAAAMVERSITLARDEDRLIPLDPRRVRTVAVIAFSAINDLTAGRTLAAQLRNAYSTVQFTRLDESLDQNMYDATLRQAAGADAIIFATFLLPISGQSHLRVPQRAKELAERVAALRRPTITIAVGDPYGAARLATAHTCLLAWQPHDDHARIAAARALAGFAPITGALPIVLPAGPEVGAVNVAFTRPRVDYRLGLAPAAAVDMSELALQSVDDIIEAAIADRAAPGAAVAIGRHGKLVRLRGYGRLDYRSGFADVTDSSIYDLASLTKVVGTTSAVLLLVQDGLLDLNTPVQQYLPEWSGSMIKEAVTVRQLLTHTAGLPPFLMLWQNTSGKDAYLGKIASLSLDYEPGSKMVYCDLGLMLVGFIVERRSGRPIDAFLHDRLFHPLGLEETLYNPLAQSIAHASMGSAAAPSRHPEQNDGRPSDLLPRIAPTEVETMFRRQHMHGRVHDENAFAAGGVAGHAGLFSSVRDLATFSQMLLNRGFYGGTRLFSVEIVDTLRHKQNDFSSRAIGWDTPAACGLGTAAGDFFSAQSIGHTGFTGTSIWIDFERDLFVVLLTNRVNPTRENQKHIALRRAVHDAVQQAIFDRAAKPRESWVNRVAGLVSVYATLLKVWAS